MEPTTTAADCAAARPARPKSVSAVASKVFMARCETYILARSYAVSRRLLRIVNETGPGRRLPRVVLTGLLAVMVLFSAAPSDAQPAVRQVLLLQSFDRGTLPVDQFTSDFRVQLDKRATEHVNVVQVVVGPRGAV